MQGRRWSPFSHFDFSIEISQAQEPLEKLALRIIYAASNAPTVGLITRAYDLYEQATCLNASHLLGFRSPHTHLAHAWTQ